MLDRLIRNLAREQDQAAFVGWDWRAERGDGEAEAMGSSGRGVRCGDPGAPGQPAKTDASKPSASFAHGRPHPGVAAMTSLLCGVRWIATACVVLVGAPLALFLLLLYLGAAVVLGLLLLAEDDECPPRFLHRSPAAPPPVRWPARSPARASASASRPSRSMAVDRRPEPHLRRAVLLFRVAHIVSISALMRSCSSLRAEGCRTPSTPGSVTGTATEKAEIKAGRVPPEWKDKPAKLRQKDRDARWTLIFGKARLREDGTRHADIAIPVFGYKSHAGIDRRYGFIRTWEVTDASSHDGRMLRHGLLDASNTAATVWADSAYRSKANEAFLEKHGFRSQIHHRKPTGRPMAPHVCRGNAGRSKVRAAVKHVFARQKGGMGLFVRTVGVARAKVKIGMANLVYNIDRLVWHERRRGLA